MYARWNGLSALMNWSDAWGMQWRELLHFSKTNRTRRRWSVKFRRRTRMVRFAMQAFGNASPHQRPAKRSRSEALVELPSSPPLPPQLQEDEHQLSATFDPDTLDCNICMESLAAPIFQVLFLPVPCSSSIFLSDYATGCSIDRLIHVRIWMR